MKRVLSFESLEKIVCLDATVPAPQGVTTPIEASPSPTDLQQAWDIAKGILVDNTGLYDVPADANYPSMAVPMQAVVLGSYGGPAPTTDPGLSAIVAVPCTAVFIG